MTPAAIRAEMTRVCQPNVLFDGQRDCDDLIRKGRETLHPGEHNFHIPDPDGHELSFAVPI